MDTKVCTGCQQEKPLSEFSWRNKKRGYRAGRCKTCHAAYRRQHYLDNRQKYLDKARRWNDENKPARVAAMREIVYQHLITHPCVDCGESDPLVLEFDHVRGKKRANISYLVQADAGVEALKREIAKCDIRCANCHHRRHAIENGWWLAKMLDEV